MRLAVLYARSRGVPSATLVLIGLCGAGAWAGHWLGTRVSLDATMARLPVTVSLAVAVAVVLAGTLHSSADEVERTTPRPWAGWRAGHAAAAAAAGVVLVAPVLPAAVYGQSSLLRNTAGLLGLALLTAAVVGPRLAWALPLWYAAAVYLSAGIRDTDGRAVWAFVMQPAGSSAAIASALLLLAAGIAVWALTARRPMR
jgi:hypothetical protein